MAIYEVKVVNEDKAQAVTADEFAVTSTGQLEFFNRSTGVAAKIAIFAAGQWQFMEAK